MNNIEQLRANEIIWSETSLAFRIRYLREERGMSRKELAFKLHVSKDTVEAYEKEDRNVPLDKITSLQEILSCSYDFLLDGIQSSTVDHILQQCMSQSHNDRKYIVCKLAESL